ncbi:MAG: hypothetical protein V3R86_07125, partial [Candidatus Hydrothermarchaeaceae archaeon]
MIKSFGEITQNALKHLEWGCVDLLARGGIHCSSKVKSKARVIMTNYNLIPRFNMDYTFEDLLCGIS